MFSTCMEVPLRPGFPMMTDISWYLVSRISEIYGVFCLAGKTLESPANMNNLEGKVRTIMSSDLFPRIHAQSSGQKGPEKGITQARHTLLICRQRKNLPLVSYCDVDMVLPGTHPWEIPPWLSPVPVCILSRLLFTLWYHLSGSTVRLNALQTDIRKGDLSRNLQDLCLTVLALCWHGPSG